MTKYGVVGTGYFGAELARFMSKVEGRKSLRFTIR